jgi:hypothetical protein
MLTLERRAQIARALMLVFLFAVPGIFYLRSSLTADSDLWWHMASGEWILAHHAVPRTDPFSAFGAGKFWAAYSWLFEVVIFKLYQRWDLAGAAVYTAGMITAITAAVYRMIRRQLSDFVLAALLTAATMDMLLPFFTPRPWLITILIFVFEIDILMHARRTGDRRGLLFLPLLFALWANTHIEFVAGLLVLGLAVAEPLAERWWPYKQTKLRSSTTWPLLAACLLATLANPYGWRIYQVAYGLVAMPGAATNVAEMTALTFRTQNEFVLLFLAFFCMAALAWTRHIPFFELAALALAITVSFRSGREIWLLAVVAVAILASLLPVTEEGLGKPPAFAIPAIALGSGALLCAAATAMQIGNAQLRADLADQMPVRAVEAIKDGHFRGPLYNTYDWGGYLIWNLRMPVSIDGRANVFGDERIARNIGTWLGHPGWNTDPDLASAGIAIGPIGNPLVDLLRSDARFQLVYQDKIAAVFVQKKLQDPAKLPQPLTGKP